jgi:hypothetical protein
MQAVLLTRYLDAFHAHRNPILHLCYLVSLSLPNCLERPRQVGDQVVRVFDPD